MKKIYIAVLASVAILGMFFSSCGGNISYNPTLKNINDSISYAYGAMMYKDGGLGALLSQQTGLVTDTTYMAAGWQQRIAAENDEAQKAVLRKQMRQQIDSIQKVNDRNQAEFLRGLEEGLKASKAQSAYVTGMSVGNQLSQGMMPNVESHLYGQDSKEKLDRNLFLSGLAASMKNKPSLIPDARMYVDGAMERAQRERKEKEFGPWRDENAKFLEENKSKEGVVTLPSGLQYRIVKEGNGPKPAETDRVKVHYHGTLIDGTVFDSSVERGEPAAFGVNRVIKGWTEVLQLMPVGSKWTIYIPYDLAYGENGSGDVIKPFSTLIFDIELLEIEK